jgi:hypothetical protein
MSLCQREQTSLEGEGHGQDQTSAQFALPHNRQGRASQTGARSQSLPSLTYLKRFAVNVTEWGIAQLVIEPDISVARVGHVVGFDTDPVSRTLAAMKERGLASWIGGWQTSLPTPVG